LEIKMGIAQKSILIEHISYTQGTLKAITEQGCEHPVTNKLLQEEIERLQKVIDIVNPKPEI
jgi:hypothetical protein